MSKPIVTLFEAYGAGASHIGPRVADALGVPWLGQSVSSEQLEAHDDRGTGHVSMNSFLNSLASLGEGHNRDAEIVENNVRQVNAAVADGGVLLGRNATFILADAPNCLHVKVDGTLEDRVTRAAEEAGIAPEQALVRQRREDAARAEMSMHLFGWDPRLTSRYDLVVSTSAFGIDGAVELILDAFRRKNPS